MSVSNALRHPNEVRPSTLNKVQNAIIVLGGEIPQPHRVAMKRVVSHRPHRRIRFITGNIPLAVRETPVYGRVFQGAVDEAGKLNFDVSFTNLDQAEYLTSRMLDENVDGLILMGNWTSCPVEPKVPVVTLMSTVFPYLGDYVGYRREGVGELIAEWFFKKGIRSAVYVGPEDHERSSAFIKTFRRLSRRVNVSAQFVDAPYKIIEGKQVIDREFMEKLAVEMGSNPPEAVFGHSDELTAIFRNICVEQSHQWTKTAWAGCNNDPQWRNLLGRNGVTVEIHAMEIGRLAVRRAVEIARNPGQPKQKLLLEPHLISDCL